MTFKGFPIEAVEFYEGLEADNSRAYWQDHRAVYDEKVRAPMEALLGELAGRWGAAHIFRPHRDVRFSKDKSPYKTNIAATLDKGGYVSFSHEGFGVGCGYYMPARDQLERYRAAVADDGTGRALQRVVDRLRAADIEVTAHEVLKTAPRGYPRDHPRIELLRHKGLIAWKQWEVGAWLDTPEPVERVDSFLRTCRPLVRWLDDHVGPSELEPDFPSS